MSRIFPGGAEIRCTRWEFGLFQELYEVRSTVRRNPRFPTRKSRVCYLANGHWQSKMSK